MSRCAGADELRTIRHTGAAWAELRWACRSEQVVHLDDLLLRRTRLGLLLRDGAAELLPRVKDIARERTRLERQPLERGGRGLRGSDRTLLRRSTGALMTATRDELMLAIDCGTQSVRALVVDLEGNILAKQPAGSGGLYDRPGGVARARRRGVLDGERRRLPRRSCRSTGPQAPREGDGGHDTTRLAHPGRQVGQAAAPLHHLARSAARPSHAAHSRLVAPRVHGRARRAARSTISPREAELNWIAEHEPERLKGAHKALLVSGWLNYRLTGQFRRLGRFAGRLPSVRLQAPGLGEVVGLEMERARRPARPDARARAGRFDPRRPDERGRRGDRAPRGPAGRRRGGRQGLRDPRRGRDHPRRRRGLLRHDGDHQRDDAALPRVDALHSALSGRPARPVRRRDPDLPRLLDGELVQAAVRPSGSRGRSGRGRCAGGSVRPAGQRRAARQPGSDAAALLDPGRPQPRARTRAAR